jgi:hypothetical protein
VCRSQKICGRIEKKLLTNFSIYDRLLQATILKKGGVMNSKKAKAIRKEVYGDFSHRATKYFINDEGTIYADKLRRKYKKAKKDAK